MPSMKDRLGVKELTAGARIHLLKALFAEFLGNLFLNFFGCAAVVHKWSPDGSADIIQIALAFGLAAASIIQCIGHVSGGHINPAVTLSMVFTSNITIVRGFLYIIAQCIGAIAGSGILVALTPEGVGGNYGTTGPDGRLTEPQALGMEFILGFILILVVFAVCDPVRNLGNQAPLAIGFAILLGHLAAVPYTGSSMNPARSFGSAVVMSHWDHHWIYWLGPSLGGICAGLIYKHVFAMQPQDKEESEYRPVRAEEKELQLINVKKGSENA